MERLNFCFSKESGIQLFSKESRDSINWHIFPISQSNTDGKNLNHSYNIQQPNIIERIHLGNKILNYMG